MIRVCSDSLLDSFDPRSSEPAGRAIRVDRGRKFAELHIYNAC
jgi:hypothetical protein